MKVRERKSQPLTLKEERLPAPVSSASAKPLSLLRQGEEGESSFWPECHRFLFLISFSHSFSNLNTSQIVALLFLFRELKLLLPVSVSLKRAI